MGSCPTSPKATTTTTSCSRSSGERIKREEGPLARAIRLGEVTEDEDMLYRTGAGSLITVRISAGPIRDEDGEIVAGVLVFQDVSERVRSERLLTAQRDIMALIAKGEPLPETLDAIVRTVEALSAYDARASILLLSGDGRHLVHGAAPSLPEAYNRAIDGVEIGASVGSCGTAAHRGETVVVTDTLSDPLWADFRELVAEHGLRAVLVDADPRRRRRAGGDVRRLLRRVARAGGARIGASST